MDAVAYHKSGRLPSPAYLPARLYASAIAVQTEWQSMTAAMIPPLTMSCGIAA